MEEVPVLLIDNKSPFCSKTMQLIFKSGGYNKFNFLSIHSEESKKLLLQYGIVTTGEKLMVLCERGNVFVKSGALLQATRKLSGLKSIFYMFILIPQKIRDSIYDRLSGSYSDR